MFSVVECLECKWCFCTEMPSVAFLCHKSAQLFLGPVQSSVCAASCDEKLHSWAHTLWICAFVGTYPSPPASLGFRQMSRGRRALLTLRSFSLYGQCIPASIQVSAHAHFHFLPIILQVERKSLIYGNSENDTSFVSPHSSRKVWWCHYANWHMTSIMWLRYGKNLSENGSSKVLLFWSLLLQPKAEPWTLIQSF